MNKSQKLHGFILSEIAGPALDGVISRCVRRGEMENAKCLDKHRDEICAEIAFGLSFRTYARLELEDIIRWKSRRVRDPR